VEVTGKKILPEVARKYLSIPATSTCERCFSTQYDMRQNDVHSKTVYCFIKRPNGIAIFFYIFRSFHPKILIKTLTNGKSGRSYSVVNRNLYRGTNEIRRYKFLLGYQRLLIFLYRNQLYIFNNKIIFFVVFVHCGFNAIFNKAY
jgi:hypothetical protein